MEYVDEVRRNTSASLPDDYEDDLDEAFARFVPLRDTDIESDIESCFSRERSPQCRPRSIATDNVFLDPRNFSPTSLRFRDPFAAMTHQSTESLAPKLGSSPRGNISSSYMHRLSSSIFSLATCVTDSYMSATGRRRPSFFGNSYSLSTSAPTSDNIPAFVIPKLTTPPRNVRSTAKAELMTFLKNRNPKGFHAAIVFDQQTKELDNEEKLYRKKIRDEIEPIDFIEVNNVGQSDGACSVFEF